MTAESCFVDTNILVYCFEKSDSSKKRTAQRLLNKLMDEDRLRLSTQVLQELYVTLTRKVRVPSTSQEVLTVLEDLAVWPVATVDFLSIRAAIELSDGTRISFWDALILVTAAQSGASILYTEDLNDRQQILGVRIANPFHH